MKWNALEPIAFAAATLVALAAGSAQAETRRHGEDAADIAAAGKVKIALVDAVTKAQMSVIRRGRLTPVEG